MKKELKHFLETTLLVEFDEEVDDDTNLFTTGLVDSYGYVELVTFLEKTYGVSIPNEDLNANALTTVNSIVQYMNERHNIS